MTEDSEQLSFNLFPDETPSPEHAAEEFDSEEAALEAIIAQKEPEDADLSWPPADPGDRPGAVPPPPASTSAEIPEQPDEKAPGKEKCLTRRQLRRLALGFLASKNPDGLGSSIRGILPRQTIDAASFYLSGTSPVSVSRTALVLAAEEPEQYLMPRLHRERTQMELEAELAKKEELEARIRETEPELNSSLFIETAAWEYEKTRMVKYHRCLRRIEKLRYDLQFSGKMERITAEHLADECYVLFPEGTALTDAIPAEWGILFASPDYSITVYRESSCSPSTAEARLNLALQAAQSAKEGFLFADGITLTGGKVGYSMPPRKRPVFHQMEM